MSSTARNGERRLSHDGAFVVQFLAGSDLTGSVGGRVEHVASGRSTHFASVDDLLHFIGDVLTRLPSKQS
jgi:hypothetical protein